MSLVSIEVIEGAFTSNEKATMLGAMTDVMARYEGESGRKNTVVTFTEIKSGDWGANGQPLTAQDVRPAGASAAVARRR
jgi:phenylpyruvate tautomerase PptA (4-oxalocrotonate tautomerase family)